MTAAIDDPVLRAWAYLSRVAEPPCAELAALVHCVGPQKAVDRVRRGLVNDDLARHTEARRGIDRAAEGRTDQLIRHGLGRLGPNAAVTPFTRLIHVAGQYI
jgi:DNA processing protein